MIFIKKYTYTNKTYDTYRQSNYQIFHIRYPKIDTRYIINPVVAVVANAIQIIYRGGVG